MKLNFLKPDIKIFFYQYIQIDKTCNYIIIMCYVTIEASILHNIYSTYLPRFKLLKTNFGHGREIQRTVNYKDLFTLKLIILYIYKRPYQFSLRP